MEEQATEKIKILIVDDEQHILQMLQMNMRTQGYDSITAETGEDALELARTESPDLILLDVMLPGIDGVETCRILKADPETKRIPILMISARSEGQDKITGLLSGADDYITKPFSLEELFLRIKASLRQVELLTASTSPTTYRKGSLELSTEKYQVTSGSERIDLTLTEFRILHYLLKKSGALIPRDTMIQAIFEQEPAEVGRSFDVHLRNIRKKLAEHQVEGCDIETVRGKGFTIG
ncbi:MAG: response regulator transcription factor [Spirochaetales bacterium]|nr:response regulator transcription factor [Spirochaetales bacterium]